MMKIHTTQNLNSFGRMNKSTNNQHIPNSEIRLNYLNEKQIVENSSDTLNINFKGKKELVEKGIRSAKNEAQKRNFIQKIGHSIDNSIDKMMYSENFNKVLDLMSHEVMVQAAISFLVCACLRPLTIMTVLAKKDKEDNTYAAAHSVSSGLVGLAASFILATPFSKGVSYMQKQGYKNLSEKVLKDLFPHLDEKSIWKDASKTIKKPVEEWLDVHGNKFNTDMKKAQLIAKPKHISEITEDTFKTLGVDIDLQAMKGKPISEWTDRSGKKIHLALEDMFVAVKEEGMGTNYFSLKHMDKDFMKEVFPKIDINTIEKDGKRLHTDFWKNQDGSEFKLNPESIHISSYRETSDAVPFYTGIKRKDTKSQVDKYVAYQTNGVNKEGSDIPIEKGSPILQDYLNKDAENDILYKSLIWLPDLITRPFVATTTIALIPLILKRLFHIEKKKPQENNQINNIQVNQQNIEKENTSRKVVA